MKEQQPKVIMIKTNKLTRDDRSLSSVSVLGENITTLSPNVDRIPRKKGKKKLSEILITYNKITQYPDNQSNKAKLGSSIDGTKSHVELTPPPNTNNQYYANGTNDKTRDSLTRQTGYSPNDTDIFA